MREGGEKRTRTSIGDEAAAAAAAAAGGIKSRKWQRQKKAPAPFGILPSIERRNEGGDQQLD